MTRQAQIADARPGNWVDRHAPGWLRPYLQLSRLDRPVGIWLLLWPCWWSTALAAVAVPYAWFGAEIWIYLALFAVGSLVMRGAGCTWNDISDRHIDAKVERTRNRPLPGGLVTTRAAVVWLGLQCFAGLAVLLQFNEFSVRLGMASLVPVFIYPFAKRVTHWPQAVLGLTFNWGALMGVAALLAAVPPAAWLLYAGCVFWTLGYDTIYALQDVEDDALAGVKSTALLFGRHTRAAVAVFYAGFVLSLLGVGIAAGLGVIYYLAVAASACHLAGQVRRLDPDRGPVCLAVFKSNITLGVLPFVGFVLG